MDRELLLSLLILLVGGPLFWVAGALALRSPLLASGTASEVARWEGLWVPGGGPLAAPAGLGGWATKEPPDAGAIAPVHLLIALPVALVWLRASTRALWSVLPGRHRGPAATVGLLRPRVFLDPAFASRLDDEAHCAALAHERAHARHYDPLRLLLARLVTDLQWPIPAAQRRFKDWCHALELARDEEARRDGADSVALAAAIVTCAKFAGHGTAAFVTLGGDGEALAERIGRLLANEVPLHVVNMRRGLVGGLISIAVLLSLAGGVLAGEEAVRILLRVLA